MSAIEHPKDIFNRLGHNGGPDIGIDPDDVKMSWIKLDIADFKRGIAGLDYETRGYYITLLVDMYDSRGRLPNDPYLLGKRLGTTSRVVNRVLAVLISQGKIYVDGEWLRNRRCDEEREKVIAVYCRRHAAAIRREADKRYAAIAGGRVSAKFQQSLPEVSPKLSQNPPMFPERFAETISNLPAKSTESTPELDHGSAQNYAHNLESRMKEEVSKYTSLAASSFKTEIVELAERGVRGESCQSSARSRAGREDAPEPSAATLAKPKRPPKPKKIATQLDPDWTLPPEWARWTLDHFRVSEHEVRIQALKFANYWRSKGGEMKDWEQTWRNWCLSPYCFESRAKATLVEGISSISSPPKFDAATHFLAPNDGEVRKGDM